MRNAATELQRLEGFISKIEDWHRMMNFMEAICKLTYNTTSQRDRGTAYYFRNLLNARNVKGEVKNSFRAYKHLYYSIFDGICYITFLNEFGLHSLDTKVELPTDFDLKSDSDKVLWLNGVCESIVKKWFFEGSDDLFQEIRDVFENPDHEENYYTVNANDGRFPCHFCEKSFTYVGSLKSHEQVKHQHSVQPVKTKPKAKKNVEDELYNYICVLFKLTALLKNLDTAIDMADSHRSVRSCKYELPIFNKTHKTKYVIGCIHLTALTEEILPVQQRERLVSNRCVNIQGGKNRNIALDEYLEMLNRDSKDIAKGNQTKESIISHSKQYPHLINYVKHFDIISEIKARKGFHKLPEYKADVHKVVKDLLEIEALKIKRNRKFHCRQFSTDTTNPFLDCYQGLATMIRRHKPLLPYGRLRNKRI